jgi:hypothetical protein
LSQERFVGSRGVRQHLQLPQQSCDVCIDRRRVERLKLVEREVGGLGKNRLGHDRWREFFGADPRQSGKKDRQARSSRLHENDSSCHSPAHRPIP